MPSAARSPLLALHAFTLITFLAASAAPTPLYRLYQSAWGFSPLLLTAAFAVYSVALLLSLLCLGALSDRVGRKPLVLAALSLQILAIGLFLLADGIGWLLTARIVQGVATALATTAVGAALLDLDRDRGALINSVAPMAGMGIGVLASTLLAQVAPAPLHLGFAILFLLFIVQWVRSLRAPETSVQRNPAAWSWRPRIAVPRAARGPMLRVSPINCSLWALGGLYLSLMPSLLRELAGEDAAWLGGVAVGLLTLTGGAAVLLARQRTPQFTLRLGGVSLVCGNVLFLLGLTLHHVPLLLLAAIVSGMGFGSGFLGALRTIVPHARPDERAGLMAAFYIQSYLINAIPVLIAGYAVGRIGLEPTAATYAACVGTLAATGTVIAWRTPQAA